jgi:phosphoglycerate dehydrogenase-like enzyme
VVPVPEAGEAAVPPLALRSHALPNVRRTPHAPAWTGQLLARRYALIARTIVRRDTGERLENPVGPPATGGVA